MTFEEFEKLPEQEGVHYELDEGELLMEPSPTFFHNAVRARIAECLRDFVDAHQLGYVIEEMDSVFCWIRRCTGKMHRRTVRNPDVAFVTGEHLRTMDINRSAVNGTPALAVEMVSPSNLAQDMQKQVKQYFSGGSSAVWVVYPTMSLVEVHVQDGIRRVKAPGSLVEEWLFGGRKFTLALSPLFSDPRGQVAENQDRTAET